MVSGNVTTLFLLLFVVFINLSPISTSGAESMQSADSWDAPVQTVEREESIAQEAPQDDQPVHTVEKGINNHEDKEISHNEVTDTKDSTKTVHEEVSTGSASRFGAASGVLFIAAVILILEL
ncbi:hypothetical protein DdX_09903 [Ditylenchus destructor]|uniref:Uncharacterized protein n=1 Tax=Ditylenchus destructor TaxID=166010 RepID=A0AAD4N1Z4_9BILA|nr:hypothetical protein DdX_09903 [Ditylenchus destructor]